MVTGGYRGDVLPFVPVATRLAQRGHTVRFVAPAEYHGLLAGEPFELAETGDELGAVFFSQYDAFLAAWGTRLGGARVPRLFLRCVAERIPQIVEGVEPLVAWADVMVTHPIVALTAGMAAERRGVAWIVGDIVPDVAAVGGQPDPRRGQPGAGHQPGVVAVRPLTAA